MILEIFKKIKVKDVFLFFFPNILGLMIVAQYKLYIFILRANQTRFLDTEQIIFVFGTHYIVFLYQRSNNKKLLFLSI